MIQCGVQLKKIADKIANMFTELDIPVKICNLKNNHISDIMTDVLAAQYICVGSPTLNNNILPTVAAFLTYLKGLAPKGKFGLAFGSYGWSGESVPQITDFLKENRF